jgi:hypothetical protein
VHQLEGASVASYTLTTTIIGTAGGWIVNTAQVTSSTEDPVGSNNSSTDRVKAR